MARHFTVIFFFCFLVELLSCDVFFPHEILAQDSDDPKILRLIEEIKARPDNAILRNNLAIAYAQRAMILYDKGQIESAITHGEQAIEQYDLAMDLTESNVIILENCAIMSLNLGVFYKSKKQYKSAEHSLIKAIDLFKKAGNEQELLNAEIRLARLYRYFMIDLNKAEEKFSEIISTKKAALDEKTLAQLYADLAGTFGKRALELYGKDEADSAITEGAKAVSNYETAMTLSAIDPDTLTAFGITCLNLEVFYKSKNQYESAEHSLIKAIDLFKKAGNEQELLNAEIRLARLYRYSMIDLNKAEEKFNEIISTKKAALDEKTLAQLYADLAGTFGKRALEFYGKDEADSAITEGAKAVSNYETAMTLSANDPDTLTAFGITCSNLGAFYKRRGNFQSVEHYLLRAAELFEKTGDRDKAINSQIQIGRLYCYSMEDPDRAEGIFKKLIAEQKDRVDEKTLSELYLELAGIYISTENPAKAKSVLTESIQKWGKDTQSHLVLGRIHHWLGEKEKAFKEFEIAEKLASSSDAKNTIGELYRQLGMCDNAKRLFNEALEGPATDSIIAAYVGLGHCSEGEKAIECYEKALALNMESNSSSMVFIRGKLLHSKFRQSGSIEELHEAIRFFQKAISAKPAESAYHNDVALAYMALYKETCEENVLQSAMNEYQLAEKCYRGFPSSILISNKANSYLTYVVAKQNGCEDARRGYYQRSLKEIAEGKAISTETVAFIDEAIAHFERAITLLPESKEAYEKLRLIYYGLRRFENVKRLESRASNFGIKLTPLKVSQ